MIWMTNDNMFQINSLWYKVSKSSVGAVFNVQSAILEVILGVPPLQTTKRVIAVKHYLKVFSQPPDIHCRFIEEETSQGNTTLLGHIRDVLRFLKWKLERFPASFDEAESQIIEERKLQQLSLLSRQACNYTRGMMDSFTKIIWQESLNNQLQMEGWSHIPMVSTRPLSIPPDTSREVEVLIMSLFYKNNLLNSFVHQHDNRIVSSPLCVCGAEEQSAIHLLTNCDTVGTIRTEKLVYLLLLCNSARSSEELPHDAVSILNCSRDKKFVQLCREVVEIEDLNLRRKITLRRRT